MPASAATTAPIGRSYTNDDGAITVVCDAEAFAYFVTTIPGAYSPEALSHAVAQMAEWGLEPIREKECHAEELDNGSVRVHYTPSVPIKFGPYLS